MQNASCGLEFSHLMASLERVALMSSGFGLNRSMINFSEIKYATNENELTQILIIKS